MQFVCDIYITRTFLPEKEENREIHYMWNTWVIRTCHCFHFVFGSLNN